MTWQNWQSSLLSSRLTPALMNLQRLQKVLVTVAWCLFLNGDTVDGNSLRTSTIIRMKTTEMRLVNSPFKSMRCVYTMITIFSWLVKRTQPSSCTPWTLNDDLARETWISNNRSQEEEETKSQGTRRDNRRRGRGSQDDDDDDDDDGLWLDPNSWKNYPGYPRGGGGHGSSSSTFSGVPRTDKHMPLLIEGNAFFRFLYSPCTKISFTPISHLITYTLPQKRKCWWFSTSTISFHFSTFHLTESS